MNIRRLAAILVADAVGFTERMATDETQTLKAVSDALAIFDKTIRLHDGRTVKTMGDGLLAEFGSVVNAVSAAADIQRSLAKEQLNSQSDLFFPFRIDVHLGDIVVQANGDIMGDGVNIAARLEQQADPGSILVSSQVYEQVIGKTKESFEDVGMRTLKGIARPFQVYAVVLSELNAPRSNPLPPLPDKPSIAVLPFANISSDPQQDYFVDGLTEDLIISISGAVSVATVFDGVAVTVVDGLFDTSCVSAL